MFESWGRAFDGDQILPNLFLGSACEDLRALKDKGITHILTATDEYKPKFTEDFVYLFVPVQDDPKTNVLSTFGLCCQFIEEVLALPDSKIFVHCSAGISRSVSIVCAFLMSRYPSLASSPEQALKHVRRHREYASPNHGFMKQLQSWQDAKFDEKHEILVKALETFSNNPTFSLHVPFGMVFKSSIVSDSRVKAIPSNGKRWY